MTLSQNSKTILFILVAFIFSLSVRLIWVEQFDGHDSFKHNGEFMINTNDGYFWAEGARDILNGGHQPNDRSPITTPISQLTALLAQILPFSFETIIFYMPAFFSSLLVIPLVLIGRSFNNLEMGFIAALLGSIAWSYYNRTMVGYYDTDLLLIVFPTFLLWSLIWALRTHEDKFIIITALEMLLYRWYYPQSYSLEFAFLVLIALYGLYLYFIKKDKGEAQFVFIVTVFMFVAISYLDELIRLSMIIGLFIVLKVKRELFIKFLYYILLIATIIFVFVGGLTPILDKLNTYIFRTETQAIGEVLKLNFFSVAQTVREAGQIPFETFANRISGHTLIFLLSLVGYIWMVVRFPIMLLGLPLIGLGFLAYSGGLRFTVYAVPVMAMGVAFLIYELSTIISSVVSSKKMKGIVKGSILILSTSLILLPNILHILSYKVPTVFTNKEVQTLEKFRTIAKREDYAVAWWDYGYPIRYYSDVKTLTDGGRQGGSKNFPVSYILTQPQSQAAKMARLDVEYLEKRFHLDEKTKWQPSNIAQMTLDYGYQDTNNFLVALETDIKLPKKTRDVYIYLPNRMLNIYPTVTLFSNIDLMTGIKGKRPFFYKTTQFNESKDYVDLGRGIKLAKKDGTLTIGNQTTKISRFVKTAYDTEGKLKTQVQNIDLRSNYSVIFMQNYNQFLVVDEQTYQSLYFQLFVLESYDKELFEPTILTPLAKIYKLKI